MGPRSRGGGQGGMPPRQRGRGGGPRGFSNRGEFGERGERTERPVGESGGLGQIDTWNPIGQEQQDQRQRHHKLQNKDAFDNAGNWGDDFPTAEDWDNDEYTSLSQSSAVGKSSPQLPALSKASLFCSLWCLCLWSCCSCPMGFQVSIWPSPPLSPTGLSVLSPLSPNSPLLLNPLGPPPLPLCLGGMPPCPPPLDLGPM